MLSPGTLIEKCNSEPGHLHQDGARGTVTKVVMATGKYNGAERAVTEAGYFVRWDGEPEKLVPQFIPVHMVREFKN